jgi:hypothetical protein
MKFEILRLTLAAPLLAGQIEGESLFCFELEPSESVKFEPDPARLLGPPINAENPVLPAGLYMFSQMRKRLRNDEVLEMAVEIQKEALWQRLLPEPRLYLRYLYEDGRDVTQVFRPYNEEAPAD